MNAEQKVQDFETWDDVVLYDVCAEVWTRLDGWLINAERKARAAGDAALADAWRRESFALGDERREIDATDRQAQAAAIVRWNERRAAIDAGAGPKATTKGEADELRLAEEAWKSLQPGRRPNAMQMTASHEDESQ